MRQLSSPVGASWRRVAAAAARLAGLYAAGVVVLLLLFALAIGEAPRRPREFGVLAAPIGACFLLGFTLLALARRAGFAALWLLLSALWMLALQESWSPLWMLPNFAMWSVLALPLYALGAIGAPSGGRMRVGRWRVSAASLVAAAWLVLAAAGVYYGNLIGDDFVPSEPYRTLAAAARFVCAPAPFLIAVFAVASFWAGTRRASLPAPAD